MPRLSMPRGFKKQDMLDASSLLNEAMEEKVSYKNLTAEQLVDSLKNQVTVITDEGDSMEALSDAIQDDWSVASTLVVFGVIDEYESPEGDVLKAGTDHIEDVDEADEELVHQCTRATGVPAKKKSAEAKEKRDIYSEPSKTTAVMMVLADNVGISKDDAKAKLADVEISNSTFNTVYSDVNKVLNYLVRQGLISGSDAPKESAE